MTLYHGVLQPTPCTIMGNPTTCAGLQSCKHGCSSNSHWAAWPNMTKCGTSVCEPQTNYLHNAKPCGQGHIFLASQCTLHNSVIKARIQDCGPAPGNLTTSICTHTTVNRIASVGPGLFRSLTGDSMGRAYWPVSLSRSS